MLPLTRRLIAEELRTGGASDTGARAAFRVSERLRKPLSKLAGVAGFRSILSRAVALAKVDAPWLSEVQINQDGSFSLAEELEARVGAEEVARGAALLIAALLGLLVTFIGEGLTLRLVRDVWPKVALKEL